MSSSSEPVVGDMVETTYNGKNTTTTPEGGKEVYSISGGGCYKESAKHNNKTKYMHKRSL